MRVTTEFERVTTERERVRAEQQYPLRKPIRNPLRKPFRKDRSRRLQSILPPFFSSETKQMKPTPIPIPAGAGGECGWSMQDLKASINAGAADYADIKKNSEVYRVVQYCIFHFAKCIVDELSVDEIKGLQVSSNDEVANALFTKHRAFVRPKCFALDELGDSIEALVRNWTLHICAAAFINSNGRDTWHCPVIVFPDRDLGGISYDIELHTSKRIREDNERKHREWVARRREQFASKDEQKEWFPDRAPADKMRVFRNGLRSRNNIGGDYWDGTYWRKPFISITKSALVNVSKLFELNPACTPVDLLTVMDGCIELFMTQPSPPESEHDDLWHARRGIDLDFFVTHIPVICEELDIYCPIQRTLG